MRAPPRNTGKVRPLWHGIENAAWGKEIKVHLEGCPTSCKYNTWKRQGINIKECFALASAVKGVQWPDGYAMLVSPNIGETAAMAAAA